jgi:hypothetical protein
VDGVCVVRQKGQQRFQAKWTVRMVEERNPDAVYTRNIALGPPREVEADAEHDIMVTWRRMTRDCVPDTKLPGWERYGRLPVPLDYTAGDFYFHSDRGRLCEVATKFCAEDATFMIPSLESFPRQSGPRRLKAVGAGTTVEREWTILQGGEVRSAAAREGRPAAVDEGGVAETGSQRCGLSAVWWWCAAVGLRVYG